jgi:hypothetical protein
LYPLAASQLQRAVTKLKVHASAASPTSEISGPSTLILIFGGIVGRIRCRTVDLVLVLFLLAGSNAAFSGKTAPKLAETIDLPQTFELDFQFAAKQRAQLGSQREVPDDIAGRVGEDVFESLEKTEMISGFRLPYTWTFRPYDSPHVGGCQGDGDVRRATERRGNRVSKHHCHNSPLRRDRIFSSRRRHFLGG